MSRIKARNPNDTAKPHEGLEQKNRAKAYFVRLLSAAALALMALMPAVGKGDMAMADQTELSPTAALERLFSEQPIRAEWFTEEFVAAVPPPRIQSIVESLQADFGTFLEVKLQGREGVIRLEHALVPVEISLDGAGRISGLLFQPPEPVGKSTRDISKSLERKALGRVAVMAAQQRRDGSWEMIAERLATEPMAVGSAFKLAVLRAYENAITSGALSRDDVIELRPEDRSLPSGVLQSMAPGVPITMETLAGLMIQQSDNTATDVLIRVLGRDTIEALSPRNQPFLTTSELFKLIAQQGHLARRNFAASDVSDRRALIDALSETPLPDAGDIEPHATWKEAEWYFTAHELCDLLSSLSDAPALSGVPDALVATEGWRDIGFKGGSEFGVFNLSAIGTTPDGRRVCTIVSANAEDAQPQDQIALLFGALFRSMGEPGQ